ncbi:MAG: hypothetical protein ACRDQG_18305, partial [Pseudonocardiaceae bacterium]
GYDWAAIAADTGNVFDLDDPFVAQWPSTGVPATFVCSSLAAYVYGKVGLDCPSGGRFVTPGDWAAWVAQRGYA